MGAACGVQKDASSTGGIKSKRRPVYVDRAAIMSGTHRKAAPVPQDTTKIVEETTLEEDLARLRQVNIAINVPVLFRYKYRQSLHRRKMLLQR